MDDNDQSDSDMEIADYIQDVNIKLKTMLYSSRYCGVCFEENNLCSVESDYEFMMNEETCCRTLKEITTFIFRGTTVIPISQYICEQCRDKILYAYRFIQKIIEISTTIEGYIESFQNKIIDLNNELDPNCDYTDTNVLLVIENGSKNKVEKFKIEDEKVKTLRDDTKRNTDLKNYILIKDDTSLKSSRPVKTKNGYKCTQCCVLLKTWKRWKIHKSEKHIPCCEICLKLFESDKLLTAHYKVHNKVKCKICHIFISDTDLKQHLKNNHFSTIHCCEECDDVFYYKDTLKVHMKIVHECEDSNTQCMMCLNHYDKDTLITHECKYKCPNCTQMPCMHQKYLTSYREQILNQVTKIKCIDCDYICRKKYLLISHANREHLNYHPYTCDFCAMQYYSKASLRKHILDIHQETYICEFCDQDFKVKKEFDDHILTCMPVKREFACGECSASFDSLEKVSSHIALQHSEFPCDLCPKKFNTEAYLKEHKGRVHRTVQMVNRLPILECTVCDVQFDTKGEYLNHMKTHGPNVKFPCKICNIELENKHKLYVHNRRHFKRENSVNKPAIVKKRVSEFICSICCKICPTKEVLRLHLKLHNNNKAVKCNICDKMVKESYLSVHLKRHEKKLDPNSKPPIRRRTHQCTCCSYSAFTRENLETHVNRYHLKIKPHICSVCGVAYSGRGQLNEHMKCHSESEKFTCPICNKKLLHRRGLKSHLMIHTGERPHLCDVCGKGYKTLSHMKEHRITHDGNKVNCPLCNEEFDALKNLREHFKRLHWKHKDRKFDPREVEGLGKEHYHLFQDNRKATVDDSE